MPQQNIPVITIDGPSGVGKGTLSLGLAKHLNWHLLDSGAIYRTFALHLVRQHIKPTQKELILQQLPHFHLEFNSTYSGIEVKLNGDVVTNEIRGEVLGGITSQIAVLPEIRENLLALQRSFRVAPGLVADGRDMGTMVFPDAQLKFFLDASPEERAKRRMAQLRALGNSATFREILSEVEQRDVRDRQRAVAPLVPAKDAIVIDSTKLSLEQVLKVAVDYTENLVNSNM